MIRFLFFTNKGKVYRAKGYEIPEYSRTAKGFRLLILLGIEKDEWINAIIPVAEFEDDWYLILYNETWYFKTFTIILICYIFETVD